MTTLLAFTAFFIIGGMILKSRLSNNAAFNVKGL